MWRSEGNFVKFQELNSGARTEIRWSGRQQEPLPAELCANLFIVFIAGESCFHLELKHFQTVCVNISICLQLSSNASTSEASASGESWAISATPERTVWFCRQVTRQRLSCHNCFCKSPKESIKHSTGSQWGQAAESLRWIPPHVSVFRQGEKNAKSTFKHYEHTWFKKTLPREVR